MFHKVAVLALALVAAAAVANGQATAVPISAQLPPCNVLSVGDYATAGNFTVLAALLDATDLYDALNGTRFTAFAPTDAAFIAALTALGVSAEELIAFDNGDTLTALLSYHVSLTPLNLTTLQSRPSTNVTTTVGANLTVLSSNNQLTVQAGDNNARVLNSTRPGEAVVQDTRCGVYVYPVNAVLLPAGTLDALAGEPPTAPAPAPGKAPTPAAATAGR